MKKVWIINLIITIVSVTVSLLPQTTFGQAAKFRTSINGVADRYIVVLDEKAIDQNASAPTVRSEADYLTAVYSGKVMNVYSNALKGFVVEMSAKAAFALSRDPRVSFVEQDAEISVSSTQTSATWGIDRIDQRALPLDTKYAYVQDASNVHAYVIDTGIRPTHIEFGGRATADYDALTDGQNGIDCNGHGSHVAGTIGAATWGVAKNIRLHGVRVLPCSGSGLISNLMMGVDWVTANHQSPAVANISITASGPSTAMDTAIQNSINSGVTYVVAAGNSNLDACNYSPARISNAITVGATYSTDDKATYSNFGTCVDIWAPGTAITSVSYANDTDSRVMSGTSMASPHVAGVAALYLAANPTASPATVAQNIMSTATTGVVNGLDANSPNKLVYGLLGNSAPAPSPGRVTIKKRANPLSPESIASAEFPYDATNFSASNFVLQPDNQYDDTNVTNFGSGNMITVNEAPVLGWALTSISCIETSGGGLPSAADSTVDLVNHKAYIIVQEGEQVECTFTSNEISPSASYASVSGRVVNGVGSGMRNIRLSLLNAATGEVQYASTNTFGYYAFRNVKVGNFYVLTAQSSKRTRILDNVRSFTLTDNLADMNFSAFNP